MSTHLHEAHEELERATEDAGSVVRKQLNSIEEGIAEQVSGERTQAEFDPKADRIAELEEKLSGLLEEAEEPTRTHIARARVHLQKFRERGENGEVGDGEERAEHE